jgi:hypothetical protein
LEAKAAEVSFKGFGDWVPVNPSGKLVGENVFLVIKLKFKHGSPFKASKLKKHLVHGPRFFYFGKINPDPV